jgi:hypothetical protein
MITEKVLEVREGKPGDAVLEASHLRPGARVVLFRHVLRDLDELPLGDVGLAQAARLIEIGWVGVYRVEYVQ